MGLAAREEHDALEDAVDCRLICRRMAAQQGLRCPPGLLSWSSSYLLALPLASYRVSHDTGHLENLVQAQALYKHKLDT